MFRLDNIIEETLSNNQNAGCQWSNLMDSFEGVPRARFEGAFWTDFVAEVGAFQKALEELDDRIGDILGSLPDCG